MRAILHGGFRSLNAADTRMAWQDFFAEMGRMTPDTVFILPWALPEKSHAGSLAAFQRRADAFWSFDHRCGLVLSASDLMGELAKLPQEASVLIYLPGGILTEKCVTEMRQLSAENFPGRVIFAGYSAGAYALTAFYYNPRKRKIVPGGGIFAGTVCCHADTGRREQLSREITQKHRPVYVLPDCVLQIVKS